MISQKYSWLKIKITGENIQNICINVQRDNLQHLFYNLTRVKTISQHIQLKNWGVCKKANISYIWH